jgi:hypothetical protein
LNEATASDPNELFNLCVYSETIILKALRELSPPQLTRFKSKLKALGGEAGDPAYHHQQACDFGECLAQNVCKFDLSPSERARAVQNIRLPGSNQDPIDTDTNTARERLYPRALLYRKQQLEVLIEDANVQLAAHLQSLLAGSQSPPQTHFDVTEFQGPSDSLLYSDNFSTRQPPIIVLTRSDPESQSKDRFTVVTDVKRRLQEAHGEFVDSLLIFPNTTLADTPPEVNKMAISTEVHLPLPVLPQGWTAEKDFKAIGTVSKATQRSIEPVGPHFLAHARRARHKRTFSEDDRIQAQESVKKVEDDDAGEISEPEDPAMLMRDAKDWKVNNLLS